METNPNIDRIVFEDLDFICPVYFEKVRDVGERLCKSFSKTFEQNVKFCTKRKCPSPWRIKHENIINKLKI